MRRPTWSVVSWPTWTGYDPGRDEPFGGQIPRILTEQWQRQRGSKEVNRYLAEGRKLNGSRNARQRGKRP